MKFRIIKRIYGGKHSYFIEQCHFLFFWCIVCGASEWPVKFETVQECESYIHGLIKNAVEEKTSVSIPVFSK